MGKRKPPEVLPPASTPAEQSADADVAAARAAATGATGAPADDANHSPGAPGENNLPAAPTPDEIADAQALAIAEAAAQAATEAGTPAPAPGSVITPDSQPAQVPATTPVSKEAQQMADTVTPAPAPAATPVTLTVNGKVYTDTTSAQAAIKESEGSWVPTLKAAVLPAVVGFLVGVAGGVYVVAPMLAKKEADNAVPLRAVK